MKKFLVLSIFFLLPSISYAAIAVDNASAGLESVTGTSLTYSYTVTGSNMFLNVCISVLAARTVSTVTYNGVAMTATPESPVVVSGDGYSNSEYYLFAPATGAHNVVITPDSSSEIYSRASSYSGVLSTVLDAHGTSQTTGTSLGVTLTTVQDNSWVIGCERSGGAGTISAGANTSFRGGTSHVGDLADTNAAQTPAGSHALNMSVTGGAVPISWVALSLSPTVPSVSTALASLLSLIQAFWIF